MDPRLDHSRMDPRMDPRLDPRMEPRMDPRMDARSMDPRLEQRMDGRMMQPSADNRSFEFGFTTAGGRREVRTLEDLFHGYGVRIATLAKMTEMGFTVSTLVNMTEAELDDVIQTISDILQMELLVGERYGIKSAVRAEKKHLEEELERQRLELLTKSERKRKLDEVTSALVTKEGVFPILAHTLKKQKIFSRVSPTSSMTFVGEGSGDASPGTVSEQRRESAMMMPESIAPVNALNLNSKEPPLLMGAGHSSLTPGLLALAENSSDSEDKRLGKKKQKRRRPKEHGEDGEDRPREHPFIVTEPGEAARGKKNGLDYLFDLYEQCGKFLEQVQQLAREKGEKCPTKVTNQVFRHAKHTGAGYINKPKMRHYVHCYALHCLDIDQSNALRKLYKERGENVGAWRGACYYPLVAMARDNNWDIEGLFNRNEKLRIWYVPTKLRQLCHVEKVKYGE
ncbi:hypothetical protein Mp_1g02860 [Marchantia polymorpha subsp. ruderalis]|uniref:Floricaula/leafy-like transcription factor n=3 Tax=Marchantia polymorpha TaxID=3197 RepID=A0AAF6AKV8_MARPO|nr:hypothetical protein MARPO_0113s0034 [Marchantia polymorpha]BBM97078.1 hypothetical protein Mp_1g02860 [Marchantia polymorpha subsp. ruderalis]|eukprot:PTQ31300.1 hypothetical protein MARPO_0113s0034 [Marchantia polymorpha]